MADRLLEFLDREIADLDQQIADIEFRLHNAFSDDDASDMKSTFSQRTLLRAPAQSTQLVAPQRRDPPGQISNAVKLPFPVFDANNVETWLWTVDRWFLACGINSDDIKFNAVLLALPAESLAILKSELDTPPSCSRYEFLRDIILRHFAKNQVQRILSLITEVDMHDKKPSTLFAEMKQLAGGSISDEVLKSLWILRLPEQLRPTLAVSSMHPAEFVKTADTIHDLITQGSSCNLINQNPSGSESFSDSSQIAAINFRRANQRQAKFGKNIIASPQLDRKRPIKGGLCWYHFKFGKRAKHCIQPCSWEGSANTIDNEL